MNKILITLNNRKLLAIFETWIVKEDNSNLLLLARDTKEAIRIMGRHKVTLVVTELMSLKAQDGFDFLAFLGSYAPQTHICTIVNEDVTSVEFEIKHINTLKMFKKPKRLDDVVKIMSLLAESYFEIGTIADVSLAEIFKLIEIEKKQCVIEISSALVNKKGLVYFEHGVLYDAFWGSLKGEDAVIEMLSWQHFEFDFIPLPLQIPIKNIQKSLDGLIEQTI